MKDVVEDIFTRCLGSISSGQQSCLRVDHLSPVEDNKTLKTPLGTALILGTDGQETEPLAIFAITSAALTADHTGLLTFVVRRAQSHKAPYFLIWTLRNAVLWKTPKLGTPAERSHLEKIRDYEDNYEISQDTDKQIFDEQLRLRTLALGKKLLSDLERLFRDQALELVQIDATYFVERLISAVHELLPMVADSLQMRLATDLDQRARIMDWAMLQGIAGSYTDKDFALSIARQIIYRLLGKIIFYQSLRRAARQLPTLDLTGIDISQVLPTLRLAFAEALKVDYHAVFAEDLPDTLSWPGEAAKQLTALIQDFNTRDFSSLPQDVIGTVFERLIPPEERHLLGQYFTSEPLCDLGISFCVQSPHAFVADMTCGTGTFLIRGYDRKKWLGNHDHSSLLSELWGVDIAPFPAELAVINLFRQNLTAPGNFPRIACLDFFTMKPGETLPFPPTKMDFEDPEQINEPIPAFDSIVGNFPYKSAEQIEKKDSNYLEFIRQTLMEDWLKEYPRLFYYAGKRQQAEYEKAIAALRHMQCERNRLKLRISTYADLYVYLFFHSAKFLKPGGRMGIITSNAWLDVNYGYELQRFFCDHFKIIAILESRCEPWFTEASVNTIFTILERCEKVNKRDEHFVKFVKVKKSLADLVQADPQIEPVEHWKRLRWLTERIENSSSKYRGTVLTGFISEEDDNFRIRVCQQGQLRKGLEHEGKTVKWGKYLRAPQVFFDVISEGRFTALSSLAKVSMGSKSGINEFYHLKPERAKELGIEAEFLKPLLKSPGESAFIPIENRQLGLRLFVCRFTKKELEKQGKTGALRYIEWGEKQVFKSGVQRGLTWPNGAEVRVRKPGWYAIPEHRSRPARVFFAQAFNDRHFHRYSSVYVIADARLYFLSPNDQVENKLLVAILNSSLCALSCEVTGRVMMGEGVLELKVEEANDYLLVPDIHKASAAHKKSISESFETLCKREIGNVFEEVKKKDRQALDAAVLTSIGLDPKKYLIPIYNGLCELVRERIELGSQRSKTRKTRARKTNAEKQVFQEVLSEILPDGPKRFPDDFLSASTLKKDLTEIRLPEEGLRLDARPLTMSLYTDKEVFREVKNPAEGKFIIYCQQAGQKTTSLPVKMVEITRTVANYESYLRDLRKTLYDAFYRHTLDVSVAAKLTQTAFERFKLPSLDS
ncbi:MAG: N-6 DNA methylase [Pseudomonadota bacterium]